MGKFLSILLASLTLFATGCLVPYCVCPCVNFVPAAHVASSDDSVYAFRIDTREATPYFPGPLQQTHQLTQIPIDTGGDVPAQLRLSCTRGFLAFFVALNYCTWHQDTISVRLYRPGYEIVELKSWALFHEIQWKPAETIEAQSKAIDDLVAGELELGGVAKEHREALLFAAKEYKRLADVLPNHKGAGFERKELLDKAQKLEKRAQDPTQRFWLERLVD